MPSPTGTVGSPSSPVLGVIVAVPLITLLLVVVLLAATAALLMCIKRCVNRAVYISDMLNVKFMVWLYLRASAASTR